MIDDDIPADTVVATGTVAIGASATPAPRVLVRRYHDGIAKARRQGRLRGRMRRRR